MFTLQQAGGDQLYSNFVKRWPLPWLPLSCLTVMRMVVPAIGAAIRAVLVIVAVIVAVRLSSRLLGCHKLALDLLQVKAAHPQHVVNVHLQQHM